MSDSGVSLHINAVIFFPSSQVQITEHFGKLVIYHRQTEAHFLLASHEKQTLGSNYRSR